VLAALVVARGRSNEGLVVRNCKSLEILPRWFEYELISASLLVVWSALFVVDVDMGAMVMV
jgi:hypothetical protein